jgi:pimeloyl-ACP methyl ester carboxylesterase
VGKPKALRALLRPVPKEEAAAIAHVLGVYQAIGSPGYPPDLECLRERFLLASSRGYTPQGFLRHLGAILSSGSRRHLLEKLDLPALVIHGSDDPLIPIAAGRATAQAIPGSRFIEVPGMGHDLPKPLFNRFSREIAETAGLR